MNISIWTKYSTRNRKKREEKQKTEYCTIVFAGFLNFPQTNSNNALETVTNRNFTLSYTGETEDLIGSHHVRSPSPNNRPESLYYKKV